MMSNHIKIFSGSANRALATKIAARVGVPLSAATLGRFPDGEIYVTFEETVRGRDVFLVQPTALQPNEYLMELFLMADAARRASAQRVTAVIPFFSYARQDRKERSRVPISAKLMANLLVAAGVNRVLTVDLHSPQIQGFFDIPVDHLYAAPLLVRYLREQAPSDRRVVVAPDPGSLKMAYSYAQLLGSGLALAGKHRTSATEVEALELVGNVDGKDCVLTDDMTTTAGTLCAAAKLAKEHGARSIRAAVSHCPITPLGIERLKDSPIEEIVTTDSIPAPDWGGYPATVLTVADMLGDAIKCIYGDEPISTLFEIHQGRTP
ncbi:MAG TPA: ribose-phosphate pyrophosphokinase [Lentisphaerae bacterium]|nr:ribose-phosphate pyrophosphokinase [Lentisphaerota bacterium]